MSRARLAAAIAVVVPLGIATKFVGGAWVRSYLGGVLYVVFFVLLVLFVRPGWRPAHVALGVFLATCAVECLQVWHPAWLDEARATFVGHALLGSTFAWADFPCYAAGSILALALCRFIKYEGGT